MRIACTLACATGLSLAACGQEPEPFPPSGASAIAWCTTTTTGAVGDCMLLQSSVPGRGGWFLEALRNFRVNPVMQNGAPAEVSMLFNLTVQRGDSPPAP
jgi:hypothetical protein